MFEVFFKAVSIRRAAYSQAEAEFVGWLANRHPPDLIDGAGNLHYDRRDGKSRTLFVAHTDTAHSTGGPNKYTYDEKAGMVRAVDSALGADDAAGIQVLCHLMENDVPGYYVFTRAEEVGGDGANYILEHHRKLLKEFDRAIAFDRKDYWNVITHQGGGECCSDEFGIALADALNAQDLIYDTDPTGIFTDTAVWVDVIPECTNLSIGYFHQHSDKEYQDLGFLKLFMAAAVKIDWEALPTVRKPEAPSRMGFARFGLNYPVSDVEFDDLVTALREAEQGKHDRLEDVLITEGYIMADEYRIIPRDLVKMVLDELLTVGNESDSVDFAYCSLQELVQAEHDCADEPLGEPH